MSRQIKKVIKRLHFTGGRFEKNKKWLSLDILPELTAYKTLLIETAKKEWRRNNPKRERLQKGFEENISLGFSEILEGSSTVPIERIEEVEDDVLEDLYVEDEVDEAVEIIDSTLEAAKEDRPFPEHLPADVIPLFEEWGRTLAHDEAIELGGKKGNEIKFDSYMRDRILGMGKNSPGPFRQLGSLSLW